MYLGHTDEPGEKEIRQLFRKVFGTNEGREVFRVLLHMMGTFNSTPVAGRGEAALRGFGMKMLELIGVNHELREQALVDMLFTVPPFDWADGKE